METVAPEQNLVNPMDCKVGYFPDKARLPEFEHWVTQVEVFLDNTCGWRVASRVLRHVRRHQSEVDSF